MSKEKKEKLNQIIEEYCCRLLDESQRKKFISIDIDGFLYELHALYVDGVREDALKESWLNEFETPKYLNIAEAIIRIQEKLEKEDGNKLLSDVAFASFVKEFLHIVNNEVEKRVQNKKGNLSEDRNEREQKSLDDIIEDLLSLQKQYNSINSYISVSTQKISSAVETAEQAKLVAQEARKVARNADNTAKMAEKAIKTISETAKKADDTAKSAEKAIETISETANNIMPNILTVVGIFIAMVIAVIVCYLTAVITKHPDNKWSTELFPIVQGLIMGQIAFNIVFLLLFLIGKLTNKSVAVSCPAADQCDSCKEKNNCRMGNRVYRRYPYIVASNFIFALAVWFFALLIVADLYFDDTIADYISKNSGVTVSAFIILLIIFVVLCYLFFIRNKQSNNFEKTH